jgi:hypothetical protein
MVAVRVQAENLAIESIREPGHRVPVQSFRGAKSPKGGVPGESGPNLGIVGNVNLVVVIEKGSARNRVVERKGCEGKQQAENQSVFLRDVKNIGSSRVLAGLLLGRIHRFH